MKIFIGIVVLTSALIAIIAFSNQAQVFLLHKMYSLGSGMDDGATELFIRNNLTGKKYAIMMREIQ